MWRCIILAAPPGAHLQAVLALEMALQVVLLGESLVAQVALIGSVPCVQVHVVLEVVAVQEAGWAVRARVGALSCVLPHVDLQLVIPGTGRGERGKGNIQDGSPGSTLSLSQPCLTPIPYHSLLHYCPMMLFTSHHLLCLLHAYLPGFLLVSPTHALTSLGWPPSTQMASPPSQIGRAHV